MPWWIACVARLLHSQQCSQAVKRQNAPSTLIGWWHAAAITWTWLFQRMAWAHTCRCNGEAHGTVRWVTWSKKVLWQGVHLETLHLFKVAGIYSHFWILHCISNLNMYISHDNYPGDTEYKLTITPLCCPRSPGQQPICPVCTFNNIA